MEKIYWSKYTNVYRQGEIVALVNSLRLRPVYLHVSIYDQLLDLIRNSNYNIEENKIEDKLINTLHENKILIKDIEYDDLILDRIKNTIEKPYINLLYLILTDQCNFNCSYCFIRNNRPPIFHEQNMSKSIAIKAIDLFIKLIKSDEEKFNDDKNIVLYGGEPLLNYNVLKEIVKHCNFLKKQDSLPQNTEISIVTNGTLITDEIASFFLDNNINVGISIDGDEISTNSNRKYNNSVKNTYTDILAGINSCKKEGLNIGLSVTLTPQSLENKETLIKTILDLGVQTLGLNLLIGKSKDLPEWYYEDASEFIIEAYKVFRDKGIMEDRMCRKINSFIKGEVYLFDCAATGGNQIVISPNGEIGICHGFLGDKRFFMDNIQNVNFDPTKINEFNEWNQRSPINMEVCNNCNALGICGGGCAFNANLNSGSIWEKDERFCVHAKKTLEWLIWDLYNNTNSSSEKAIMF